MEFFMKKFLYVLPIVLVASNANLKGSGDLDKEIKKIKRTAAAMMERIKKEYESCLVKNQGNRKKQTECYHGALDEAYKLGESEARAITNLEKQSQQK